MSRWESCKVVTFRVTEMDEPVYKTLYKPVYALNGRYLREESTQTLITPSEHKKHEFKLGPGPCGEDVKELFMLADELGVRVQQVTDKSTKTFIYPWSQIHSRIVVEFPH